MRVWKVLLTVMLVMALFVLLTAPAAPASAAPLEMEPTGIVAGGDVGAYGPAISLKLTTFNDSRGLWLDVGALNSDGLKAFAGLSTEISQFDKATFGLSKRGGVGWTNDVWLLYFTLDLEGVLNW